VANITTKRLFSQATCPHKRIARHKKDKLQFTADGADDFKSWFIDFEPFAGARFIESELGKIPAG